MSPEEIRAIVREEIGKRHPPAWQVALKAAGAGALGALVAVVREWLARH